VRGTRRNAATRAKSAHFAAKGIFLTEPSFLTLGVAEPIRRALAAENYYQPTPIQIAAIPLVLAGRDVVGIAQTGTGKTAAFGLPLLQCLARERVHAGPQSTRVLILSPTRELAIQIHEALRGYARHLSLRHAVILGGVTQRRQVDELRLGVDILVATPGRLLDLVAQKHVRLGAVTRLVIDEADRMLDMGFIRDVRRIVAALPTPRQTMLFSATMPKEVAHLAREILHNPARIDVSPQAVAADNIAQHVYFVETKDKRSLLHHLLRNPDMTRVIVFTRTKHGADKVADHLGRAGHYAEAIHGNKSQSTRLRALEMFRSGRARILVATDIAARGIDIDDVSHVINYELPDVAENYVHRIGRTARAGSGGTAIAFCDSAERQALKAIECFVKQELTVAGGKRRVIDEAAAARNHPNFTRGRNGRARHGHHAAA
jgi:ATP-dependent RNA helicase RhlE